MRFQSTLRSNPQILGCVSNNTMSLTSHPYNRTSHKLTSLSTRSHFGARNSLLVHNTETLALRRRLCFTKLYSRRLKSKHNYRVRQKYLTIWQNNCEWNRWRGEFVLERPFSETQSISVAMERWSVEHRAFAVETYFKNNDSVLTQKIFRRHFNIHRNECP
jgi:hypothetical protein